MTNILSSFWDIFGVFLHYSPIQLTFLFASWQVPLFLSVSSNLPCISLLCRITKLKSSDLNLGEPLVSRAWHVTDKVSINHFSRYMSDNGYFQLIRELHFLIWKQWNRKIAKKCFFFVTQATLNNKLLNLRTRIQMYVLFGDDWSNKFALSARFLLLNCTY